MAGGSSSAPFFGIGEEDLEGHIKPNRLSSSTPTSSVAAPPPAAPQKKRRNLPGTPNPDAEVIALSPKTLLATNRFICEVCNKGFQREQNLQLHRRGHNLPWKLRQKSTNEVKQRVYLCPESTCVHHDPSRALGDLTGIKKHFCRKHGEKKWKCEKCSKRYAVQSDLKAHSKTCGTREYRCGCGTLFSRRDSFVTHRAFCDALAQENARLPTGLNTTGDQLYGGGSSMALGLSPINSQISTLQGQSLQPSSDLLRLGGRAHFDHFISSPSLSNLLPPHASASSSSFLPGGANQDFQESQSHHSSFPNKPFHRLMQLPEVQSSTTASSPAAASSVANLFNLSFFSNSSSTSNITSGNVNASKVQSPHLMVSDQFGNDNTGTEQTAVFHINLMGNHMSSCDHPSLYNTTAQDNSMLPQMSATALLQKAAQMGATMSNSDESFLLRGFESSYSTNAAPANYRASFGCTSGRESMRKQMRNETHLQDLMNSLADGNVGIDLVSSGGEAAFRGSCTSGGHVEEAPFHGFNASLYNMEEAKLHQNLSMGSIAGSDRLTRDFLGISSMVRSIGGRMAQREQHHGIDIASLDSEIKSASTRPSFAGGNL